ncbi:MAG: PhoU domain-containing protein [Ignavibacteriaceae bacterium]
MIKEILSVFKANTLMDRAFQRSYDMLDLTYNMYLQAKEVLRNTEHTELEVDLSDEDIEVNKYQREVRKDVFNHLVLTDGEQLSSGLVLVSIVIDLERIGDYTKNIVEVAQNHPQRLHGGKFEDDLLRIEDGVDDNFKRTIEVFKTSDEDAGRQLLKEYKWIPRLSDKSLMSLVQQADPSITSGSAAALALYFRSLKRINAHLRNVTTSVVNPFHRIGYKPKKKKA